MIFLKLFWSFFKIGAVIFGGGYAMLPLIQEAVINNGWGSAQQFADIVTVAQLTPGPISLNTATYAGKIAAGFPGALTACFGLICPALIITSVVFYFLNKHLEKSKHLQHIINGIRSAAMGLISVAVLFFAEQSIFNKPLPLSIKSWSMLSFFNWSNYGFSLTGLLIFILVLFLAGKKNISPILCLLLSALLGIIFLNK